MTQATGTPTQLAFRIALRWPDYTPTAKEILREFSMETTSAYRYASVYRQERLRILRNES